MSDFASPRAAATVEAAMRRPHYEALADIRDAYDDAGADERREIVFALSEALLVARGHTIARDVAEENAVTDDVFCGYRVGEVPQYDATSQRVGVSVLFGRRTLRLWFPLTDIMGMVNSFLSDRIRQDLRHRLSSDREGAL